MSDQLHAAVRHRHHALPGRRDGRRDRPAAAGNRSRGAWRGRMASVHTRAAMTMPPWNPGPGLVRQSCVRTQSRRDHDDQGRSRRDQLHPDILARDLVPLPRLDLEAILRTRPDKPLVRARVDGVRKRAGGLGRIPSGACASEPGVSGRSPIRRLRQRAGVSGAEPRSVHRVSGRGCRARGRPLSLRAAFVIVVLPMVHRCSATRTAAVTRSAPQTAVAMVVPIEPSEGVTGRVTRNSSSPRAIPPTMAPTMLEALASIAIRSARNGSPAPASLPWVARRMGTASTITTAPRGPAGSAQGTAGVDDADAPVELQGERGRRGTRPPDPDRRGNRQDAGSRAPHWAGAVARAARRPCPHPGSSASGSSESHGPSTDHAQPRVDAAP